MMLNRADECRRRANECRRNAAQLADAVLRGTYLDLARRWSMMTHQAETPEKEGETKRTRAFQMRLLGIALFIIVGSAAICGSAWPNFGVIARRAAGAIIGRAAGAGMIGAIAGDKSPRAVFFPVLWR